MRRIRPWGFVAGEVGRWRRARTTLTLGGGFTEGRGDGWGYDCGLNQPLPLGVVVMVVGKAESGIAASLESWGEAHSSW
jgi:hypothetical protein